MHASHARTPTQQRITCAQQPRTHRHTSMGTPATNNAGALGHMLQPLAHPVARERMSEAATRGCGPTQAGSRCVWVPVRVRVCACACCLTVTKRLCSSPRATASLRTWTLDRAAMRSPHSVPAAKGRGMVDKQGTLPHAATTAPCDSGSACLSVAVQRGAVLQPNCGGRGAWRDLAAKRGRSATVQQSQAGATAGRSHAAYNGRPARARARAA